MEFEPGAESDRHFVVRIMKAIGKALRLLIIGEYSKEYEEYLEQLPKPEKPRREERPDFVCRGIQGEESPITKAFLISHGDEFFERSTWPQSKQPRRPH